MSDSIWDDPRITSYVLDELSDAERSAFESEMSAQSELATAVAEARGITGRIGDLFEGESTPKLDRARRDAIIAGAKTPAMGTGDTTLAESIHPAPSWGVPLAVIAMAATLLLLVGVAPWMRQASTVTAIAPTIENNDNEQLLARAEPKQPGSDGLKADSVDAEMADLESALGPQLADRKPAVMNLKSADPTATDAVAITMKDADRPLLSMAPGAADVVPLAQVTDGAVEMRLDESRFSAGSIPTAASLGLPDIDSLADVEADPKSEGSVRRMAANGSDRSRGMRGDDSMGRARARVRESMGAVVAREKISEIGSDGDGQVDEAVDVDIVKKIIDQESAAAPMAEAPARPSVSNDAMKTRSMDRAAVPSPAAASAAPLAAGVASEKTIAKSKAAPDPRQTIEPMTAQDALLFNDRPQETDFEKDADSELLKRRSTRLAISGFSESKLNRLNNRRKIDRGFDDEMRALNEKLFGGNRVGERSGNQNRLIVENEFKQVSETPVSSFSIEVGTASYRKVRDDVLRAGKLPGSVAVRIEEMVNYFDYGYAPPASDAENPFASHMLVTDCPWNPKHRLARVAIQGKAVDEAQRRPCNLVFLLDTSGSMDAPNKLPLLTEGIGTLLNRMTRKDRVAIAVYADATGLVLKSTPASKKKRIRRALSELAGGGSTANGEGIQLAFQVARENFIEDGVNRVIVCTDGDFTVGMANKDDLASLIKKEAESGIFVSALAIRMGNQDDAVVEALSGFGKGDFALIDSQAEVQNVLADQTRRIPVTIAKDAQLQLEFNPRLVSQYRLIGYENGGWADGYVSRNIQDASEFVAGQSVTAIYEIVPVGEGADATLADDVSLADGDGLKYSRKPAATDKDSAGKTTAEKVPSIDQHSRELFTLTLSYTLPDQDEDAVVEFVLDDRESEFSDANESMQFATAVAGFGMQLRSSKHVGNWTMEDVMSVAEQSLGEDEFQLRNEFLQMVRKADELKKSGE